MRRNFVIIGAGISGLSLAYFLTKAKKNVTIIEKNNYVGGLSSSFQYNGFTLDIGPHKLYSQIPEMMNFFKEILGKQVIQVKKRNSIYLMEKYFSFPIKIKNIVGNISNKTIFGGLKIGLSALPVFIPKTKKPKNFEEYFIQGFGKGFYSAMFKGYAKKVWGDPKKLSPELARKRIPIESIPRFFSHIFDKEKGKKVSAEFFYYPKKGVIDISKKLAQEIKKKGGKIILKSKVEKIIIKNNHAKKIVIKNKKKVSAIKADYVISTTHINELTNMMDIKPIKKYSEKLRYSDLLLFYIFLNQEHALEDNWIFFPEDGIIFNRVSEQKSFSKFTAPKNKTVICAEVTILPDSDLNEEKIYETVKRDLIKVGLVKESKIQDYLIRKVENVYPIYDLNYKENLNVMIREINKIKNFLTIGRYGLFNYNNIDHCIDMSKRTADSIINNREKEDWSKLMEHIDSYRIVD